VAITFTMYGVELRIFWLSSNAVKNLLKRRISFHFEPATNHLPWLSPNE
jgi:hypothetical protein